MIQLSAASSNGAVSWSRQVMRDWFHFEHNQEESSGLKSSRDMIRIAVDSRLMDSLEWLMVARSSSDPLLRSEFLERVAWLSVEPASEKNYGAFQCLILSDWTQALKIQGGEPSKVILPYSSGAFERFGRNSRYYFVAHENLPNELRFPTSLYFGSFWNLREKMIVIKGGEGMSLFTLGGELLEIKKTLFEISLLVTGLSVCGCPVDLIQRLLKPALQKVVSVPGVQFLSPELVAKRLNQLPHQS